MACKGLFCILPQLLPSGIVYYMHLLSGFMKTVILPRNKLFCLGLKACETKKAVLMYITHVFVSVSMCELLYLTQERGFANTTFHTPQNRFCISTCLFYKVVFIISALCRLLTSAIQSPVATVCTAMFNINLWRLTTYIYQH